MAQLLRDKSSLFLSLLFDHPMCLDCISAKTERSTIETDSCLTIIGAVLQLQRTDECCRNCGTENGAVYWLRRPANWTTTPPRTAQGMSARRAA